MGSIHATSLISTVNEDLLEELATYHPDAQVDRKGNIIVYHRTTRNNAQNILRTGVMEAKEDALFFSSKENGYASDYGESVIKFKIPSALKNTPNFSKNSFRSGALIRFLNSVIVSFISVKFSP